MQSLFMMRRGVGVEQRSGRLLVPKLDYLQLLAVVWTKDKLQGLWGMFASAWAHMATLDSMSDSDDDPSASECVPAAVVWTGSLSFCNLLMLSAHVQGGQNHRCMFVSTWAPALNLISVSDEDPSASYCVPAARV